MNNCMKFIIIFHFILSVISMNPKLCVNCKYFRGTFMMDQFGKCLKSPIVNDIDYFLVTGVKPSKKIDYNYCSIVRKYNPECGPEGKSFEKR